MISITDHKLIVVEKHKLTKLHDQFERLFCDFDESTNSCNAYSGEYIKSVMPELFELFETLFAGR